MTYVYWAGVPGIGAVHRTTISGIAAVVAAYIARDPGAPIPDVWRVRVKGLSVEDFTDWPASSRRIYSKAVREELGGC